MNLNWDNTLSTGIGNIDENEEITVNLIFLYRP